MCLSVSHHVETSDCCLLVEMDRGKKLKRVCEMQHLCVHNLNKWNVFSWSLISGLAVFSQSSAYSHLRQLPRSVSAHLSVSCAFWPLSILTLSVSSVRGAGCHGFIGIGGCFQLANPAWRSSNPEMNALHARRSCPEFTSVHSQARRLQPGSESELSVCLSVPVCLYPWTSGFTRHLNVKMHEWPVWPSVLLFVSFTIRKMISLWLFLALQ